VQPESSTTAVGEIMWCHCSETTSTGCAYGSESCSNCVCWCTRHFPALHRLTSPNFAFQSLQSVRVHHSGQLLTVLCSSREPIWSSASVRSSLQPQLLGTVSLTMFGARQHWMSSNSAWKRICLYNHTIYRLSWALLLTNDVSISLFSVRHPCNVYWHVTAPYKSSFYYYYYYYYY